MSINLLFSDPEQQKAFVRFYKSLPEVRKYFFKFKCLYL